MSFGRFFMIRLVKSKWFFVKSFLTIKIIPEMICLNSESWFIKFSIEWEYLGVCAV